MVTVRHDDLAMAFDFVSYAGPMEHSAYVSLDTGKIWWTSDSGDAFDEELPDDLETSGRYLARYRIGTSLISEDASPCALSHRSCLRVRSRSRDFSGGKRPTRVSRVYSNVKAFSSVGIRLRPMLTKAR